MSIVIQKGKLFLGFGGRLVAEYPDAVQFEYEQALDEAEKIDGILIHNYGTEDEQAEDY